MNYEQFAIWLHGFLEISNAEEINKEQTQIIKDHLALLFDKKTPDRIKNIDGDGLAEIQSKFQLEIQRKIKEWEEAHPRKATPLYPSYPPGSPLPYPGFDPHKNTCDQGTGTPLQQLPTSVCSNEIALGKQFREYSGELFDTELHKTKTYC